MTPHRLQESIGGSLPATLAAHLQAVCLQYDEAALVFRPHSPGTPSRSPSRSPSRLSRVSFPVNTSAAVPSPTRSATPTGGGEFMQAVAKGRIEMEKQHEDSDADRLAACAGVSQGWERWGPS